MHRLSKEVRRRSGNSQFALDNALINEFGYGNHTIDRGIVTYLNIHSLCTLYISALQLVIVLTPDADQHLQLSYKEREDTFLIKLRDIRHIETNRNPLPHKSRLYREEREVVRRTTYIYLRGDRVCAIDTYGSNKFAKAITASWHSTIIHESCFAVNRISAGDATIASEYYKETIQSLLDFSRVQLDSEKADPDQRFHHVVVDRTTIPDLIEVLNEFSIEVSTDLELKDIVFNSREIIMLCFILLDNVLKEKPTTKVKPSNRKPAKGTSQSLDSPRTVPLSEVSNEQHMKAKFDLVSKLQLIDMIFKLFQSIFHNSESLVSRIDVLTGPSPMVFATWLSYLVPDLYQQLCMAAMCPLEDPDFSDLDNYESMRAVAESSTYDSSKKSNFPRTSTSASAAAFELRAGSIPLKFARGMQGLCLAQENNTSNDQSLMNSMIVDKDHPFYQDLTVKNVLPKVRQSITDLQRILTLEISSFMSYGRTLGTVLDGQTLNTSTNEAYGPQQPTTNVRKKVLRNNFSRIKNIASANLHMDRSHQQMASSILRREQSLGENYTQINLWEASVESLVNRVSAVLDDMLASDHVLTRGKKSGINADLHVYTHESIADSVHSEGKVHVSSLSIKTSDSIADLAPENSSYKLPTNPLALPPSPFLSMRNTLSKRSLISPRTNDTASSNEIGSPEVRLRSSSKIARRVSFSDGGDGGPILSARKTLLNQISSKGIAYNSEESSPSMSYPTVPTKISLGIKAEKDPIQEFASGNCESLNGDFDQEICLSKNYLDYFPLLTQEILLFYTTSLIRSLALDSAKVRALLRIELSTYLTAIMAVFNELCPRPIFISGPPLLPCYLYASPRKRGQKIMKKLSKYSRKLYNMVGRAIPEPDVVEERQVETEGNPRNASNANIHSNNIDNVDNEMVMYNSVVYSQMSIFKSVRKKITKVADQMKETIGLSTGGNITIEEILERELLDDAGGPQSPHSVDHNIHTDRSDLTNIYNIGIHPDSPMKKLKNELLFPDTAEAGKYEENDKNFSNQKVSRSTQSKDDAEYCLQAAWSSTCKVLDFDSPRYGLSKASWMLLILSRFAIEETIHLIQLDPVHLGIFEPDLIPHKSVIREEMAKQRANSLK